MTSLMSSIRKQTNLFVTSNQEKLTSCNFAILPTEVLDQTAEQYFSCDLIDQPVIKIVVYLLSDRFIF